MKFFDISMQISEDMQVYPQNPRVTITQVSEASASSTMLSVMRMGSHTGTHCDAPRHVKKGALSVDRIDLSHFYGPCVVIDASSIPFGGMIDVEHVRGVRAKRVLFKTRNSTLKKFRPDYVYVSEAAGRALVKKGVKTVGVDYLSVQKFHQGSCASHCALLLHGAVVIEGLRLKDVPAGKFTFCGAPLKVRAADGAPMRAFLVQQ